MADKQIPPGAIPEEQFNSTLAQPAEAMSAIPEGAIPEDQFQSSESAYGTTKQQIVTGIEGLAEGVLGPLAPAIETKVLGIPEADILARKEENPVSKGVGQATGLIGSVVSGVGAGAMMEQAGAKAAQLARLQAPVTTAAKIGSSVVRNAVETAVFQAGDETSKMILNDPDQSAETAISSIGLATAIGGGAGGFITGIVSPLWKATAAKPTEKFLTGIKDHLDGVGLSLAKDTEDAAKTLGVELMPEVKAGLSGNPKAAQLFNELREHPQIMAGVKQVEQQTADSILSSLGRSSDDILNYSEAEGGRAAMDTFRKEYDTIYAPIAKEYDSLVEPFKAAELTPLHQANLADKVVEVAQAKGYLAADMPQSKVVNAVLDRIAKQDTAEGLKTIQVAVNNLSKGDLNLSAVANDMKALIRQAQNEAITDKIGAEAPQLMERYMQVNKAYSQFAKVSEELGTELGLGKFGGHGNFLQRLAEKRSPEEFLRRLSPKGNANIINFLQKNFPETLEAIRDNELKQLIKPSLLSAKGDSVINIKSLANTIDKGMAGQKERIAFALPEEAIKKIQAAKTLQDAMPKSTGQASWQLKMGLLPQSAMSAIAYLTGHNPVMGFLVGHLGKMLAGGAPDAAKLGLLRFMMSENPIKAEGFKAMTDFMQKTIRGAQKINKASEAVFKPGAFIVVANEMRNIKANAKLDKLVAEYQEMPDKMLELTNGETGYYLPEHQMALSKTTAGQIQYLQALKPRAFKPSPLDTPIEPSKQDVSRYQKALDIANNPTVVLQKVKDGTVEPTDLQDLKGLYPALYQKFAQDITNQMNNAQADDVLIPYKTRMGVSLFLGMPLDSTMTPDSIMSAQPIPKEAPPAPMAKPKRNTSAIGKNNKNYLTPDQAAQQHKGSRD